MRIKLETLELKLAQITTGIKTIATDATSPPTVPMNATSPQKQDAKCSLSIFGNNNSAGVHIFANRNAGGGELSCIIQVLVTRASNPSTLDTRWFARERIYH